MKKTSKAKPPKAAGVLLEAGDPRAPKARKAKPAPENRGKTGAKPPLGVRFQPGVCPNPGGRPKTIAEVQELAREQTPLAIATLAGICESSESDSARVAAANALLDRGWGKARQDVQLTGENGGPLRIATGMENFNDQQLVDIARAAQDVVSAAEAAAARASKGVAGAVGGGVDAPPPGRAPGADATAVEVPPVPGA